MTKLEREILKEKAYQWEKIYDILGPERLAEVGYDPVEAVRRLVTEADARAPKIPVEITFCKNGLLQNTVTWEGITYDIVERKKEWMP